MPFGDRREAGRQLARKLERYKGDDVVVLGLPRGGVPVAWEVARELEAPLDVFVVRKLGLPIHEELAMGAIASGGVRVLNREVIRDAGVTQEEIERVDARERVELERREKAYRRGGEAVPVDGKIVIVVDDGVATGASLRAALEALALRNVKKIVAAVPVAPRETVADLQRFADEVDCVEMPSPFYAVGYWYRDFSQTSDEEVKQLLDEAAKRQLAASR